MNRYQVIEAFVDGDKPRIQPLNLHASFTSAFWYYPASSDRVMAHEQLYVIDVKKQEIYSWLQVERMMFFECLKRIEQQRQLPFQYARALLACGYVDANQTITNKGWELISEIERPVIRIELPYIKSITKMRLGQN